MKTQELSEITVFAAVLWVIYPSHIICALHYPPSVCHADYQCTLSLINLRGMADDGEEQGRVRLSKAEYEERARERLRREDEEMTRQHEVGLWHADVHVQEVKL